MSKYADLIIRCTTLEEALAVSCAASHYISEDACKLRFADVSSQHGHLDFVFETQTMYAKHWGHYPELCDMGIAPRHLPIISGWEFLGESPEVFPSTFPLNPCWPGVLRNVVIPQIHRHHPLPLFR